MDYTHDPFLIDRNTAEVVRLIGSVTSSGRVRASEVESGDDDQHGSYQHLLSLGNPADIWYPLVDVNGNVGSADFGPSDPFFTELELSTLGRAWFDYEPGRPVWPIGLCNGEWKLGGVPPLDPTRVGALVTRAKKAKPALADVISLLGPPSYPTGCEVEADLEVLYSGYPTELVLRPKVELGETWLDHTGLATRVILIHSVPAMLPLCALIPLVETVALELWGPNRPHFDFQDPSGPDARTRYLQIEGLDPTNAVDLGRELRASKVLGLTQRAQYQRPIIEIVSGWLSGPGTAFDEARSVY